MTDEEKTEEKPKPKKKEPISEELIKKADEAAERLEAANIKHEELIKQDEAAKTEETLGGEADAGTPQVKEDSDEDYAKKVMGNDIKTE